MCSLTRPLAATCLVILSVCARSFAARLNRNRGPQLDPAGPVISLGIDIRLERNRLFSEPGSGDDQRHRMRSMG